MTLKLIASDTDDLRVISAALQDAIVKVGEIDYDAGARSLTFRASRFTNETPGARVLSGLRVDGITDLQYRSIDREMPDGLAVLLSVEFQDADLPPGGHITFKFAGSGDIRASVDAIDLILADVSEPRRTRSTPDHD